MAISRMPNEYGETQQQTFQSIDAAVLVSRFSLLYPPFVSTSIFRCPYACISHPLNPLYPVPLQERPEHAGIAVARARDVRVAGRHSSSTITGASNNYMGKLDAAAANGGGKGGEMKSV